MKTSTTRIILGTAAVLMATGLAACSKSETGQSSAQMSAEQAAATQSAKIQNAATQAAATQATTTFAIEKMTCASCPISVRKAMKRVDGVKSVKVDFETKLAVVVYDPAQTTPDEISAASTDVGYPASEVTG